MHPLSKTRRALALTAICALLLGVWVYFGTQKIDFHMDEYLSFVQANNPEMDYYGFPQNQLLKPEIIDEYASADPGHRFDFSIAYRNVVNHGSTHPPLYHATLHFFCSFMPGTFSQWPGLIFNYITLLATVTAVYFLARALFHREGAALFSALLFGLLNGTVYMAEYIRMYNLLMLFCVLITLWHIKALRKGGGPARHLPLLALTLLGAMTQFYFLFFMLFLAVFYGIAQLVRRNYRALGLYCLTMALAAGLFFLLYPSVLNQFSGEGVRGGQALGQLRGFSWAHYRNSLLAYFKTACKIPFARVRAGALLFPLTGAALIPAWKRLSGEGRLGLGMMAAVCGCYFLLVAQIAPAPQIRYLSPIIPLWACAMPGVLCLGFERIFKWKKSLLPLCAGGLCAAMALSLWLYPVQTCFRETLEDQTLLKPYRHLNALYLGERPLWHFTRMKDLTGFMFSDPEILGQADWQSLGDSYLVIADSTLDGRGDELALQAARLSGHQTAVPVGSLRRRAEVYLIQ